MPGELGAGFCQDRPGTYPPGEFPGAEPGAGEPGCERFRYRCHGCGGTAGAAWQYAAGHLGLIASGRVVLGDIAATAVDLSLRGWLETESSGDGDGGWMLASAEPPQDSQDLVEYELVLLGWLARPGYPAGLASLAADLPAGLAQVRKELVRDAVHRGWLRRLHHHERTAAGEELARQLKAFRRDLRAARAGGGPEVLDGPLMPYALHCGLARADHPLAQFAHAWVAAFAELPEWRAPARQRTSSLHDTGTSARKRTLEEDIMSADVGAMLWVTGW